MNKLLFRERSLYRSRHGWIFGICQGLADYTGISVTAIRIIFIVFFILSGFFPIVLIYLLAAILMSPEPMVNFESDEEKEFYLYIIREANAVCNTFPSYFNGDDINEFWIDHWESSLKYSDRYIASHTTNSEKITSK